MTPSSETVQNSRWAAFGNAGLRKILVLARRGGFRGADPDRGGRLAGLRSDARSARPRLRRALAVPARARFWCWSPARSPTASAAAPSWRSASPSRRICAVSLLAFTAAGIQPVGLVFVVLVAFGTARAFSGPGQQSLLPNLVPPEVLRQRHRAELLRLADRDDLRPGAGRPALRHRAAKPPTARPSCSSSRPPSSSSSCRAPARKIVPQPASLATDRRRLPLHLAREDRARRHLARSFRRAARRRDGAPAGLCPRHPRRRALGARAAPSRHRRSAPSRSRSTSPPVRFATMPAC